MTHVENMSEQKRAESCTDLILDWNFRLYENGAWKCDIFIPLLKTSLFLNGWDWERFRFYKYDYEGGYTRFD